MRNRKFLMAVAAAASVLMPVQQLLACSPITTVVDEGIFKSQSVSRWRTGQDCLEIRTDMLAYLADVRAGRVSLDKASKAATDFENGTAGCEKDRVFARQIVTALATRPARVGTFPDQLSSRAGFMLRNPELFGKKRVDEIWKHYWLSTDYPYGAPAGWDEARYRKLFDEPGIWEAARLQYGGWRPRDQIAYGMLTDPQSSRFDPLTAAAYATTHGGIHEQIRVAKLLLDYSADPKYRQAAEGLLDWYSPYVQRAPEEAEQGWAVWQRIAEQLARSADPAERARGNAILVTGDPHGSFGPLLPQVEGLVMLDSWPADWPHLDWGESRLGGSYPPRALRSGRGGIVSTSLLFGPDGKFQKVWITRSSGSELLDETTAVNFERYVRPKLSTLLLSGHPGRSVLVPFADVEWRIDDDGEGAKWVDGRLVITAGRLLTYGTC